jgi:hypothetical protein
MDEPLIIDIVVWAQRCQDGYRRVRYVHIVQYEDIDTSGGRMTKKKQAKVPSHHPSFKDVASQHIRISRRSLGLLW